MFLQLPKLFVSLISSSPCSPYVFSQDYPPHYPWRSWTPIPSWKPSAMHLGEDEAKTGGISMGGLHHGNGVSFTPPVKCHGDRYTPKIAFQVGVIIFQSTFFCIQIKFLGCNGIVWDTLSPINHQWNMTEYLKDNYYWSVYYWLVFRYSPWKLRGEKTMVRKQLSFWNSGHLNFPGCNLKILNKNRHH